MASESNTPEPESIAAFVAAVENHDKVLSVTRRDDANILDVSLESGESIAVFMTNTYVVGVADVQEVSRKFEDIGAIVTLSAWNMVSKEARQFGSGRKVGVFTWRDFFGALNYKKFWLYEPMPLGIDNKKSAAEKKRRRQAWN